jgi:hypothetical protein
MKFTNLLVCISTAASEQNFKELIGADPVRPSIIASECGIDPREASLAQYMPGLEYMLQAAVSLSQRTISVSKDDLCQFGRQVRTLPVEESVAAKELFHKFWRNFLAEYFVTYAQPYQLEYNFKAVNNPAGASILVMGQNLDSQYPNFLNSTGHAMPESVERKFFEFVDQASNTFVVDHIWSLWQQTNPFEHNVFPPTVVIQEEPRCAIGGVVDPPRLSPPREAWKTIQRISVYPLTATKKGDFCSIVGEFDEAYHPPPPWGKFDSIESDLNRFEVSILSPLIPHIIRICEDIIRVLNTNLVQLRMIDSLVAELGKEEACPILKETETDDSLKGDKLIGRLFRANIRQRRSENPSRI